MESPLRLWCQLNMTRLTTSHHAMEASSAFTWIRIKKKKLRRKNKEVFLLHSFKSSHLPHNLLPFMLFKTCRLKYLCHYSHPPFSLCSHPFLLYLNVFKNVLKPKKKPSRELCGAVFLQNNIYTYIFMLQNPIVMRSCLPFLNIF